MLRITSLDEGLELFKALGSDMRIQILNLLLEHKQLSMNQIASRLNITNGALTGHIKKLESCGLITTSGEAAGHGNQKLCAISTRRILIDVEKEAEVGNIYATELRIGQYSDFSICPTCGLSTEAALVGEVDDPRYFDHPDRFNAEILWFSKGYIEYAIPNLIPRSQTINSISISCELSSEAPGINNNWPSDIRFTINGHTVGQWTSPGDFGDERGLLTPEWWPENWNQYGLLKLLTVNKKGTFIDGLRVSDVTIDTLQLQPGKSIRLRISIDEDAVHVGGLTLFGKTFGNYSQGIRVSLNYTPA